MRFCFCVFFYRNFPITTALVLCASGAAVLLSVTLGGLVGWFFFENFFSLFTVEGHFYAELAMSAAADDDDESDRN